MQRYVLIILIKELLTFNAPYFEMLQKYVFHMSFFMIISFIHYTIYN